MKNTVPGHPVVKKSHANAEDTGSIPDLGRFHMPWGNQASVLQLLMPTHPEPVICNKRSHHNETLIQCNQSDPRLPQPETACEQQ